ncbi:hypothetical protein PR202_ga08482 [Eleusine coracana subsp. coracana]|uniref:Nucleotide-diphospho-sugar transferase domain-containing protein n=1 Tax=Eleusine coracana subsp. coracana TaxID=191504 RepID=A0AAV5C0D5_ELECO|nr:hypothetical protein QOZ80_1AG0044620 [Eleusine coracana subsp. coracana]GJM92055.1 hypothetical protein PR202_ga08482 [Eleusine coracana subsp. coracana]
MGSQQNVLNQLVSFILGASAAAVLLFFLTSAGSASRSTGISSWANGTLEFADGPLQDASSPATEAAVHADEKGTTEPDDELERLLRAVADEDRTVIMTSVNEAWAAQDSLLDLFLEGIRNGERTAHFADHLLVVALDGGALRRCRAVHPHCYLLPAAAGRNLSDEKVFMSKDYIDLVWSKVRLQQRILELGYNFLFTDVDILWFRNPLERMSVAAHMVTSSDFFFGEPYSPFNLPNTGFLYAKSSARTVGAFEAWRAARASFPGKHEQQVLNEIKHDLVAKRGLRIQFLDTEHNAGFCNNTRDFNTLYTMHANCCVGLGAKLHDLGNLLKEWQAYRQMDEAERRRGPVRWKVPGICIH